MELAPGKCKKKHRKNIHLFHDTFSESSLSSVSETQFCSFKCLANKRRRRGKNHSRHDHLTKLFERKKLKEKSLSKKMKTPFDRKINRSCWPIELKKVSKIKKKPREKRKEKPTYRSLTRKKFKNPTLVPVVSHDGENFLKSSRVTANLLQFLDGDSFKNVYHCIKKHYLYEQITPQLLMSILQDERNSEKGVTIDVIIERLKTMYKELDFSLDQLKEEILEKLNCAIKLGLVIEHNGYYKILSQSKKPKTHTSAKHKHCHCHHTQSSKGNGT